MINIVGAAFARLWAYGLRGGLRGLRLGSGGADLLIIFAASTLIVLFAASDNSVYLIGSMCIVVTRLLWWISRFGQNSEDQVIVRSDPAVNTHCEADERWARHAAKSPEYVPVGGLNRNEPRMASYAFDGFGRLLRDIVGLILALGFRFVSWLILIFIAVRVVSCAWHL